MSDKKRHDRIQEIRANYYTSSETASFFGIQTITLHRWDDSGKLEEIGIRSFVDPLSSFRYYSIEDVKRVYSKMVEDSLNDSLARSKIVD